MICHECKRGGGYHTPECRRGRALKRVLQENDFLYGNAPITSLVEYKGMEEARKQFRADQVKPSWADDVRFKEFTSKGVASFEMTDFDPLECDLDKTEARIKHIASLWACDLGRPVGEVFDYVNKLLWFRYKAGLKPLKISFSEVEAHYIDTE